MPDSALATTPTSPSTRSPEIQRLMVFFALVYVAEGMGQMAGMISQPLNYYLKQVLHWTPVQVTAYLAALTFPWFIKPLYGVVSDFIPIFGSRRKAYVLFANGLAALAYFGVTMVSQPSHLIVFLFLTAYGMAISSAVCGAVLVESGQKFRASGMFVSQQWLWYNIAAIAASLIGGLLVEKLAPVSALHAAAAMIAFAPLAVVFLGAILIKDEKRAINVAGFKQTWSGLSQTFKSPKFWTIVVFLFLYNFSPGFATPLYYHLTDHLKFPQIYIGVLGSIASVGWIVGGVIYRKFLHRLSSKTALNISIAFGVVATLAFLGLEGKISAALVYFLSGMAAMIAYVASLTLAADFCPKQSEGFSYAILMSVANLAMSGADIVGSYFYEHIFKNQLPPLIWVSALFTAVAFLLVPILRLGDKRQGDPALTDAASPATREL
jgi:MFS family permease